MMTKPELVPPTPQDSTLRTLRICKGIQPNFPEFNGNVSQVYASHILLLFCVSVSVNMTQQMDCE